MPQELHKDVSESPLGRRVGTPSAPDARVLFPVTRVQARSEIGVDARELPFVGVDIWNAYELSWLDTRGKPHVAIAELRVPADSPNLIESKSLKLYLNAYAQTRFDDAIELRNAIARDLGEAAGASVEISLIESDDFPKQTISELPGASLDEQDIVIGNYGPPQPEHLRANTRARQIEESVTTRLFRSNCPVTGQPDWAAMQIRYIGAPIDRAGLLRYLISYREHCGFHEACVERIFADVMARCAPRALSVYARFTRRGGLDINPWRATSGYAMPPLNVRMARQ
ncbi:MAG TPA: NADPH-dependent 7-cyano-7-deazaguanine reductase QueF [Rhodanobacteraceae bacterium]|nr:NADPH-dependent 7-cyano-7-deazaguanine reductase QueF [Rhodanobacteraceae bacterium]